MKKRLFAIVIATLPVLLIAAAVHAWWQYAGWLVAQGGW